MPTVKTKTTATATVTVTKTPAKIIKLIDANVDGCGTDITCFLQVKGKNFTKANVRHVKNAVEKFKKENSDFTTDELFGFVADYLKSKGYKVKDVTPVEDFNIVL